MWHCRNCKDMPKFGGPGRKKQSCLGRRCTVMFLEVVVDEHLEKVRMQCMNAYRIQQLNIAIVCIIMFLRTSNTEAKHCSFM